MDTSSQPGENTHIDKNAEKRQKDLLEMTTSAISAHPGLSERLLPYLIAAMETCWVDALLIALASMNFFQHRTTLLPLWTPFVLIASACWLMIFLERRELVKGLPVENERKRISGASWFILLMAVLVLLVVWATIYAPFFLFFDPRWLLSLLGDFFRLGTTIYYVFTLVALSIYFCWRGVRLAHSTIEPSNVFWTLRLGMGIIIVAIIAYTGSGSGLFNELILFSIVPCFLFLALVAHAFAKVLFLRSNAPGGLQGSVAGQERAILITIGMIGCVILVLALLIGSVANPAFLINVQRGLEPLGRLYDWLVSIIAYGIALLLYPIFWLLSFIHIKTLPHQSLLKPAQTRIISRAQASDPIITIVLPVLKIVLPILFILVLTRAIFWLLNRRRLRLVQREQQDFSESIWSWHLFLTQLRALLLAIWRRIFPLSTHDEDAVAKGEIDSEATNRSIRAIYRALLRWAALRGYGRRKEETPHEFKERLQQKIPLGELELANLTNSYSELRYGERVLNEEEETRAQRDWAALQDKAL